CLASVRDKSVVKQFVVNETCIRKISLSEYVSNIKPSVGKVGRVIKTILSDIGSKVTDHDIEVFVECFKSCVEVTKNEFHNIRIVNGNDIHKYYQTIEQLPGGTLAKSCMRNVSQEKLSLYTKNPEKCSMVVLFSKCGKVKGRALLWKDDQGRYLMDRIYTSKNGSVEEFKIFAEAKGYWSKVRQSADESKIELNGVKKYMDMRVTVDMREVHQIDGFVSLPYLDSFNALRENAEKSDNEYIKLTLTPK
ncbi:hypothetical protein EBU94_06385, partial [bacterium]|nr:hypothetical protein [bacterium]